MPDPITVRPAEQHDADVLRRRAATDHGSPPLRVAPAITA